MVLTQGFPRAAAVSVAADAADASVDPSAPGTRLLGGADLAARDAAAAAEAADAAMGRAARDARPAGVADVAAAAAPT